MELSIFHPEDAQPRRGGGAGGREEDYFHLEGKRLVLSKPLDRDADDLSSIMLQVRREIQCNPTNIVSDGSPEQVLKW